MTQKIRIAVIGLGGVGGYFGGRLAEKYHGSGDFEIIFVTRPNTEKVIRERGLKLITPGEERVLFPDIVTSDPTILGQIDYLICSVKSYDLEESLLPFKNSISSQTVILPLLNGVDSKERIARIFPHTQVWDGCVYIVSRVIEPGVVKETGNIHTLYFGSSTANTERPEQFYNILKNANIDAFLSQNIEQTIWEKFLFISPIASLTSLLDLPIGAIVSNVDHRKMLLNLIGELRNIAFEKGISFPEDILERTLSKMEKLPFETTSSMHSDFKKGGRTEFVSLTEYVVDLGRKLDIKTPAYNFVLKGLNKQSKVKNL